MLRHRNCNLTRYTTIAGLLSLAYTVTLYVYGYLQTVPYSDRYAPALFAF